MTCFTGSQDTGVEAYSACLSGGSFHFIRELKVLRIRACGISETQERKPDKGLVTGHAKSLFGSFTCFIELRKRRGGSRRLVKSAECAVD